MMLTTRQQDRTTRNIVSVEAVHSVADNAAGIAIKVGLQASLHGKLRKIRNPQEGVNMLQTAERCVAKLGDLFIRARELWVQAANDSLYTMERWYLDTEFQDVLGGLIASPSRRITTGDSSSTAVMAPTTPTSCPFRSARGRAPTVD